jgi:hypothetical protein
MAHWLEKPRKAGQAGGQEGCDVLIKEINVDLIQQGFSREWIV